MSDVAHNMYVCTSIVRLQWSALGSKARPGGQAADSREAGYNSAAQASLRCSATYARTPPQLPRGHKAHEAILKQNACDFFCDGP